jgi:non-heme chloroperoxidase
MAWFTLSDGVPLWYEDQGEGPVVLLVPGWTYTTRFYDKQLSDLSRDHRIVSLDLRGHGNSGKTPDGHSLSQYASDILELVDALGLEDVTYVGWATAASVGVHVLIRDPARFKGFVWIDHSPRFFVADGWEYALSGQLDPWGLDGMIAGLRNNRLEATRNLVTSGFYEQPCDADLEWMVAEIFKMPTEQMAQVLACVANVDVRPYLPQVSVPVLVVNGRESIVPVGVGAWIAQQVPHGRNIVLDGCGHHPYLEKPEEFNAALREFVKNPRA